MEVVDENLTVGQELNEMPQAGRLAFKAFIYEACALLIVYLLSKWWFEEPPVQTIEYTLVLFIALCIYYFVFHYIFEWFLKL